MKFFIALAMVFSAVMAQAAETVCYNPATDALSWLQVQVKDIHGNFIRFEKTSTVNRKMQTVCLEFAPENGEIVDATVMQLGVYGQPDFAMCSFANVTRSLKIEASGNYYNARCYQFP